MEYDVENNPLTVQEIRNLSPEELGDIFIGLSKKGRERPSLATRVEEVANRIQQQAGLNADVYTGCRIKDGACYKWIISIGSPGKPFTLVVDAVYDSMEDNFQVSLRVYHKREAIINTSERTLQPQPEDYEKVAVDAVLKARDKAKNQKENTDGSEN